MFHKLFGQNFIQFQFKLLVCRFIDHTSNERSLKIEVHPHIMRKGVLSSLKKGDLLLNGPLYRFGFSARALEFPKIQITLCN